MYVVLGASGNTGHVVAQQLLAEGKKVRAISRNAEHLQFLTADSAEKFVGDAANAESLTKAFQQAEAVYVMIPPNTTTDDVRGFQNRVSDSIAKALRTAAVKNVVALSSIGAEKPSGTGPVAGLYDFEQKLSQLDANVLFLRAGYFMENTLPQAPAIRATGSTVGPLRPDLKLPMIASRDIGRAAAQSLSRLDFRGKQIHELHGERDLDFNEITRIIGLAIGKPDLKYIQAPADRMRPTLVQMGMSENFASLLLEMAAALNSGSMHFRESRTAGNTTPTTYENFVAEFFVPAYRQQAAA